jgi:UDP-N-acetyl-D-mannosaminuronic acid dehydrogenase
LHKEIRKIVIMGLGYIGLPTASMLATKGHQVVGVDINSSVVETINSGEIHIVEPDLDILVRSAVNSGNLKASLKPEEADTFIIAVPTPFKNIEGNPKAPDISYVEAATKTIAPYLKSGNLIILESTSPIGTTERIRDIIFELRPDLCNLSCDSVITPLLYLAHCPERVLPGHILRELVDNDRIIGGINTESSERACQLYKSFCNGNIFLTDARTAEMAKLTENSFRDVNIAFANELSMICDELDINVWELIKLANKHPRVNILQPGPGVGGHCIAVDPWFIVDAAPEQARLIRTARQVNDSKSDWVIEKVVDAVTAWRNENSITTKPVPIIGCLGLAFKPNIDDLRESPALKIVRDLMTRGLGRLMACEPNVSNDDFQEQPLYTLAEVLSDADILVILVDHDEFKSIDRSKLEKMVIIDTKGVL